MPYEVEYNSTQLSSELDGALLPHKAVFGGSNGSMERVMTGDSHSAIAFVCSAGRLVWYTASSIGTICAAVRVELVGPRGDRGRAPHICLFFCACSYISARP